MYLTMHGHTLHNYFVGVIFIFVLLSGRQYYHQPRDRDPPKQGACPPPHIVRGRRSCTPDPTNGDSGDSQCPGAQKCCNSRCEDPYVEPDPPKQGACPPPHIAPGGRSCTPDPTNGDSGDSQCPGNQKCCNSRCEDPFVQPEPPKPGRCPPSHIARGSRSCVFDLINGDSGDSQCPGAQKCCNSRCEDPYVDPDPPKPGRCPPSHIARGTGSCVPDLINGDSGDSQCPGNQKCCNSRCEDPYVEPRPDPPKPGMCPPSHIARGRRSCSPDITNGGSGDSQCPGNQKCCNRMCEDPHVQPPPPNGGGGGIPDIALANDPLPDSWLPIPIDGQLPGGQPPRPDQFPVVNSLNPLQFLREMPNTGPRQADASNPGFLAPIISNSNPIAPDPRPFNPPSQGQWNSNPQLRGPAPSSYDPSCPAAGFVSMIASGNEVTCHNYVCTNPRQMCCSDGSQGVCIDNPNVGAAVPPSTTTSRCPAPRMGNCHHSGPDECVTDFSCGHREICCDTGCKKECISDPKFGGINHLGSSAQYVCPNPGVSSSISFSSNIGKCLEYITCSSDNDCNGKKCCHMNGCGRVCLQGEIIQQQPNIPAPSVQNPNFPTGHNTAPKPVNTQGKCPAWQTHQECGNYQECNDDADCHGNKLCCPFSGCWKNICVDPKIPVAQSSTIRSKFSLQAQSGAIPSMSFNKRRYGGL